MMLDPIGRMATRAADIRSRLGHPVVDADGHWIETAPIMKDFFLDFVKDLGGGDLAARFEAAGGLDYDDTVLRPWSALSDEERRNIWATRPPDPRPRNRPPPPPAPRETR